MSLLNSLLTPCVVIDKNQFINNCERMANIAAQQGLTLRPHVKTLKSVAAAKTYAPLNGPITVSTLAEANYFADAGYEDILYAVGLTPNKFEHVNQLLTKSPLFTVTLDSIDAVKALLAFANQLSQRLSVVLEVDTDDHRAGLLPDAAELVECATLLHNTEHLHFRGIMTHAGASYECFSADSRTQIAAQECQRLVGAANLIESNDIPVALKSAGSTPTALAGIQHQGINELRAGVYATFDCVMAGLGVCRFTDIAMSVLTSVIGHQRTKNWVLIDAGWMALSRDQGTAEHNLDCGYGLVCDVQGNILDGWYVASTNQEHGIICHRDKVAPPESLFAYGTLLRILPIHACATAAQHKHYHLVNAENQVEAIWDSISGW